MITEKYRRIFYSGKSREIMKLKLYTFLFIYVFIQYYLFIFYHT